MCISLSWEHEAQQVTSTVWHRGGFGQEVARGNAWIRREATAMVTTRPQGGQQGVEARHRQAVWGPPRGLFLLCGGRRPCRSNGITRTTAVGPLGIVKQQRRQGSAPVPFDIIGPQTQEERRAHALGDAMPHGPAPAIPPWECAQELVNARQGCRVTPGVRR